MDFETWLKDTFQTMREKAPLKPQAGCLTEEDMTCLLDDKLTSQQRKVFAKHLATCIPCADSFKDHVLISQSLQTEPMIDAPQHVVERAKALVTGEVQQNLFEIILNFTQDAIELVRTTGKMLSPVVAGPVLRTGKKAESLNQIKIAEAFGNLIIEVEIQKKGPDLADITVKAVEKEKRKDLEGFRVSLFKENRELRSKLTEKGKAKFEGVKIGNYRIMIEKERFSAALQLTFHPNS